MVFNETSRKSRYNSRFLPLRRAGARLSRKRSGERYSAASALQIITAVPARKTYHNPAIYIPLRALNQHVSLHRVSGTTRRSRAVVYRLNT